MSEIQFPSPTALLGPRPAAPLVQAPPVVAPGPSSSPPTNNVKRKPSATKPKLSKSRPDLASPVTKPKQSKSRNGCVTCKNKRLKCDETKPTCQQCSKRQVQCGGYKKDWKWKEFNECTVINKPPAPAKAKKPTPKQDLPTPQSQSPPALESADLTLGAKPPSDTPRSLRPPSPADTPQERDGGSPQHTSSNQPNEPNSPHRPVPLDLSVQANGLPAGSDTGLTPGLAGLCLPPNHGIVPAPSFLPSPGPTDYLSLDYFKPEPNDHDITTSIDRSSLSMDLIPMDTGADDMDDSEIEEIVRTTEGGGMIPQIGKVEEYTDGLGIFSNFSNLDIPDAFLGQPPAFSPYSSEMLLGQFHKSTSGILSVRNGQHENPWRTMLYPLIHESPALFHAIASMAALHSSKHRRDMKVQALEHRMQSIELLKSSIHVMRPDIAIAITLVLAFAESWDSDFMVSTGIQHLQGAKSFLTHAISSVQPHEAPSEISARVRFLCNTWVYMDVIARLTSLEGDDSNDFDDALWTSMSTSGGMHEIDPLMGCASTMFPLIGRVANLVRKVRLRPTNSISIVSQASELKRLLEDWQPPGPFLEPEDEQCDIDAALETAEAYRWATLLYLHQAVPEIPSRSSGQLAKKALIKLALVPLRSKTIIVQIYPLLAAGCEASNEEDREWVRQRWVDMARIMNIGNIDRCQEVVKEVWDRRDMYAVEVSRSRKRSSRGSSGMFSPVRSSFGPDSDIDTWGLSRMGSADGDMGGSPDHMGRREEHVWGQMRGRQSDVESESLSPGHFSRERTGSIEVREELHVERTVRGRQHWIGVMNDWNWEVLLG